MLNIEDINKLHKDFPEPEAVTQIRKNITESFKNLVFEPDKHKYYVKENGKKIFLPSVSSIVSSFEPYANWDMIAENYAVKNNMDTDVVKRMWREKNIKSTNNGTSTHLFLESYMWFFLGMPEKIDPVILPQYEDGWLIPYSSKQEAGVKYFQDLYDSFYNSNAPIKVYPVMPEARMYILKDNIFGLKKRFAGTMDLTLAYQDPTDGVWKLIIDDWKTNESLINTYNRENKKNLKKPFDDYIDESFSKYTLQLSGYSIMAKQLNYEIPYRNIVWLKDDGIYERYPINDLSQRLIENL